MRFAQCVTDVNANERRMNGTIWEKRYVAAFALLFATGFLLYLLAPVLTPFLIGAMLAYIANPLAEKAERLGMSRTWAVSLVFSTLFLGLTIAVVLLVPLIQEQIAALASRLPDYVDRLQYVFLPWLQARLAEIGVRFDIDSVKQAIVEHWQQLGASVGTLLLSVTRSSMAVLSWIVNVVLIPLVTFYLLRDWRKLLGQIRGLIPVRIQPVAVRLAHDCDQVLGGFLRGQLMVMLALGVIYSVGLWIAGIELALLIGIGAGLLSFVPFLGTALGVIIASIAAVAQYQDAIHVLYVALVFAVGQILEGWVLSPMLVGDRIGLHPLGVIFAVMAGGQLFGFFGVLLALPVAAVIMVLLRYAHERYVRSQVYAGMED